MPAGVGAMTQNQPKAGEPAAKPASRSSGKMNGTAHEPEPRELDAAPAHGVKSAGDALNEAAERHGEASRKANLETLTGVLEALTSADRSVGTVARQVQVQADKLAETTIEAEANLR